jgi:hypothetical protein
MKQTVYKSDFHDAFIKMGRKENFSYAGLNALYDYLENLEDDTGEEMELDVIALCCEYTEYSDIAEFQNDYGEEYETIEDIEDKTTVIRIDDESFIIQAF